MAYVAHGVRLLQPITYSCVFLPSSPLGLQSKLPAGQVCEPLNGLAKAPKRDHYGD